MSNLNRLFERKSILQVKVAELPTHYTFVPFA